MSSSWFCTKKRGRDDVAIERDRETALAARRSTKKPAAAAAAKKKKTANGGSKKRKKNKKEYEDSPSSMEDFIVDDEEEEEDISLGEDEYDDDSSESTTAAESTSSQITNDERKPAFSSVTSSSKYTSKRSRSNLSSETKSSSAMMIDLCNDDDSSSSSSDDSSIEVLENSHPTAAATTTAAKKAFVALNDATQKVSRFFPKAPPTPEEETPVFFRKRQQSQGKRPFLLDDDSDDESPQPSSKPSLVASKSDEARNSSIFNESGSDEEDEERALKLALQESLKDIGNSATDIETAKDTSTQKKNDKNDLSLYDDDDDDDLALSLALSQSLMESSASFLQDTPENTKIHKKKAENKKRTDGAKLFRDDSEVSKKQEPKKPTIINTNIDDILHESDDDDDDNNNSDDNINEDEDDDYVDPAAREAQSVLKTANELSAQIIQTLQEWSDQSVAGLISSGALTLGTSGMVGKSSSSSSHQWISQAEMTKCCPKLTLPEYQLIGVNWMALLHGMQCKVGGVKTNVNGILADEMGLGKTIQTISFLSWLGRDRMREESDVIDLVETPQKEDDSLPHLVIAPASVLSNWEREFETFAPHLRVVKYHGSMDDRNELQRELRQCFPGRGKSAPDVILAPVTYFQKEKSDDRSFLRKFEYEYLVVDEGHLLKNARGTRYKTLDKFQTRHRLLLTGTPVQNSPQELLSLLCFLMPLFSRKAEPYDDDEGNDGGQSMLQHFVSLEGGGGVCDEETTYGKLKQLFAPFVLRRRKEDVLSQIIPPKVQKVEFVELDSTGRRLYDSVLSDHIKSKKNGGAQQREHLFTQLRKAAHHPLLLRSRHTSSAEKEHMARWFHRYGAFRGEGCTRKKVAEELERFNDFMVHLTAHDLITENPLRHNELGRYILQEEDLFSSAKFVRLQQLLPQLISEGHRILIFSGWTSCLDLLTCLLEKLRIEYLRMEGSTPVEERQSLIDRFNRETSIPVFLLSTKACGLGINLTSSDTCLFYDIDFNPMNDAQAEDRCHRIGQKKEVTVIRLVSKDTVDQDIYEMQQRKMKMSQVIMETNGGSQSGGNNKRSAKEKSQVLQTALDRFLQSPAAQRKNKENNENSSQESRDIV